jgi:membrane associated rhomboid family serine protease
MICADCSHDSAVGQRCPECSAPQGRHREVRVRRDVFGGASFQTAPVTITLIALNVAIFVLGFLSPDLGDALVERFALVSKDLAAQFGTEGEWWRTVTSAFLHGSMAHILFNMYALYIFGPRLEQQVGSPAFAAMYVACATAGGAASYLLGSSISIGASGAIFGLFGAWLFVAWRMRNTPGGRGMFNQLFVLLAINLALPLLIPNIDWRAHLGGLAAGILIAWLWSLLAVGRPNAVAIRTSIALMVMAASIVITVLA